jgi:DNA-binding NtrC family response regulator
MNLEDMNQETSLTSEHFPSLSRLVIRSGLGLDGVDNLNEAVEKVEQETIKRALQKTHHNKAQTAKLLGLNKSVLYRKLKKYNLTSE